MLQNTEMMRDLARGSTEKYEAVGSCASCTGILVETLNEPCLFTETNFQNTSACQYF